MRTIERGYRIDISPYGFYANPPIGFELNELNLPATIDIGKRFRVGTNFIDLRGEATGTSGSGLTLFGTTGVYSSLRKTRRDMVK